VGWVFNMDYFEYNTASGKSLLGELLAACKWEDRGLMLAIRR